MRCNKAKPGARAAPQRTSPGTASRASRRTDGAPGAAARLRARLPRTRLAAAVACGPGSAPASGARLNPRYLQQLCSGSTRAAVKMSMFFSQSLRQARQNPAARQTSRYGARLQQAHDRGALRHQHAVDLQRRQQPRRHLPQLSTPRRTSELKATGPPEQHMGGLRSAAHLRSCKGYAHADRTVDKTSTVLRGRAFNADTPKHVREQDTQLYTWATVQLGTWQQLYILGNPMCDMRHRGGRSPRRAPCVCTRAACRRSSACLSSLSCRVSASLRAARRKCCVRTCRYTKTYSGTCTTQWEQSNVPAARRARSTGTTPRCPCTTTNALLSSSRR